MHSLFQKPQEKIWHLKCRNQFNTHSVAASKIEVCFKCPKRKTSIHYKILFQPIILTNGVDKSLGYMNGRYTYTRHKGSAHIYLGKPKQNKKPHTTRRSKVVVAWHCVFKPLIFMLLYLSSHKERLSQLFKLVLSSKWDIVRQYCVHKKCWKKIIGQFKQSIKC